MSDLRHTPLEAFHMEKGARMVPFAGWSMPVQYSSILEEHRAVREAVGLFDVSHMGEVLVTGAAAAEFLDYLVTNSVGTLKPGKAVYSCMCYENGGVVDDLIIYRMAETSFLVCVNAGNAEKDVAWMSEKVELFDCAMECVSEKYAQIALQGPNADAVMKSLVDEAAIGIKRFAFVETKIAEVDIILCRTGYTGEEGFEIYCPAVEGGNIAQIIFDAGQAHGLKLCGLGSRDSLRLEAGFPLYGHEISELISPLQAGLGWTVKLSKPGDFIGKEALQAEKAKGVERQIVHFVLEGRRIARQGSDVLCDGDAVGNVVSGTLSPMLGLPIGAALVDAEVLKKGSPLYVDLRGNCEPLRIKKPPLHKY